MIVNGIKVRIGDLEQVQFDRKDEMYRFVFVSGYTLEIRKDILFFHTMLKSDNDCFFLEFCQKTVFSGLLAHYLYETCGLPLDFTSEELDRNGIPVDETGFRILEGIQRERSSNTFAKKDAFG